MGDGADEALDRMMDMDELETRYNGDFDAAFEDGVAEMLFDYNGAPFGTVFGGPNMGRKSNTRRRRERKQRQKQREKSSQANAPICPYCQTRGVLIDSAELYHGKSYGWAWNCPKCPRVYVGCHKGTQEPLGRMANAELRQAKMDAHASFDRLWKRGMMSRSNAYRWLQRAMGMDEPAHIGEFDLEQCRRAIALSRAYQPPVGDEDLFPDRPDDCDDDYDDDVMFRGPKEDF